METEVRRSNRIPYRDPSVSFEYFFSWIESDFDDTGAVPARMEVGREVVERSRKQLLSVGKLRCQSETAIFMQCR